MNKKVKRSLSVLIVFFMVMGLLAGCGQSDTTADVSYSPGTYTAEVYGYLSYLTVETTFNDSEITDVKVVEQSETPELFTLVENQVPGAIVENQSLGIDTVSGATISSMAIINAVSECVDQAGGDASVLRANKIEKQPGEAEEYTTDVVIIGMGASGFMAAHNAAINGADVMAIEKGASVAVSNGVKVSGPFAVDTPVLQAQDSKLTVDKAFYHMMDYSHWSVNAALVKRSLETSSEAVTQLMDMGYEFKEADFRFETPFKGEYGGFHLILNPLEERVNIWESTLEKDGVEVLYNTVGEKLITDGDMVVGVEATKKDGTKVTINAEAVILATGGFVGNKEMIEKYFSGAEINPAGGSLSTGDGINMALEVGAVMDKTFGICGSEYGGTNTKASRSAKQDKYDQNTAFKFGVYGGLYVDAQGERFMNEGQMVDYPMSFGSESIIRNSPYYAIVDQKFVDAMKTQGLYEYTREKGAPDDWTIGNYYKGKILTNLDADLEEGIKEGWIYKADTIEELAEYFDTPNLAKTVETYNSFVEGGKDLLFDKNPMYLSEIGEAPYYIIENEFSGWSTIGGIRVDASLRALNDDNKPIPGLYVIGADAGSLFSTPYYDIPGSFYGLAIDSGTIAGKETAAYVLEN
ncbi:FAD-binding protein [Alkalibacter mobilis]|uniref:FAD-binding protein n=1 Tax=Alkalibacter mobilis TaxID=2787712 RepID=UPI00189E8A76|nr:FAD-binding protein [Alkalibacter mobilis]MBF7096450.1 FAD-binding protein [Alkalibacter mobilis]